VAEDRLTDRFTSATNRVAPVLVGRRHEQELLAQELMDALAGGGRLILLNGEAGIGKTSLARNLAREAVARGVCVLTGHCYDLTNTPPYGPWLDLFSDYRLNSDPAPPAAFAGGRLQASITDQAALFREVHDFFGDLSRRNPILLVLEDLHWADPASIQLLRYFAARLALLPLVVVATYRTEEITRQHPLAAQLPAIVRESEALRLDLKRLCAEDLRELLAAHFALGETDRSRLVIYLLEHADGNPFFVTELLRALREWSFLRQSGNGWSLAALDHLVLPSLLSQVIDSRIARLGEGTRALLAIAAVIGHEVELDLWSDVGEVDEETLLGIVELAVAGNLLDAEREGTRVRFVHALTREALYESMLPPRRRAWHRRIADALMARAAPDPDAVAAHLQRAHDPRAAEWLIRAGDRAQRAYALLTAVDRFRSAATLLEGVAGEERTRGLLLYRLARLLRFSTPAAAIPHLDEAERLATIAGDPVLEHEVLWSRGLLHCYADRFDLGVPELEAGISGLEALPASTTTTAGAFEVWLADALPSRDAMGDKANPDLIPVAVAGIQHRRGGHAWFAAESGRIAEAIKTGEAFVQGITPERRVGSLIGSAAGHAWQGLGIAYAALGRPDAARAAYARARAFYRPLDHHAVIAFSYLGEMRNVVLTYQADEPETRHELAAEAEEALGRAGGALVPGLSRRLAWLPSLVLDGRWAEAATLISELPPPGPCYLRREITAAAATLARHRGNADQAWQAIAEILPEGPDALPGTKIHLEALALQRLAAALALDAGDLPLAQSWLAAHDRWLAWNGTFLGRADGQLSWARYHRARGDMASAHACAAQALALATEPRQPLALLAANRLLGELAGEAHNVDAAAAHLQTALDLAAACAAPLERALTLLALVELRLRQGAAEDAAALLGEATASSGRARRAAAARQSGGAPSATFHFTRGNGPPLRADRARAGCAPAGGGRSDQSGHRGAALHQSAHGWPASAWRLRQARRLHSRRSDAGGNRARVDLNPYSAPFDADVAGPALLRASVKLRHLLDARPIRLSLLCW
jgi:hypothetical protein